MLLLLLENFFLSINYWVTSASGHYLVEVNLLWTLIYLLSLCWIAIFFMIELWLSILMKLLKLWNLLVLSSHEWWWLFWLTPYCLLRNTHWSSTKIECLRITLLKFLWDAFDDIVWNFIFFNFNRRLTNICRRLLQTFEEFTIYLFIFLFWFAYIIILIFHLCQSKYFIRGRWNRIWLWTYRLIFFVNVIIPYKF